MKFDLYGGKYTYLINEDGSNQRALRHGEPWRDLVGDGFVLAMAHEINEKDKRIAELEQENKDLDESLTIAYMQGYSDGKAKLKEQGDE